MRNSLLPGSWQRASRRGARARRHLNPTGDELRDVLDAPLDAAVDLIGGQSAHNASPAIKSGSTYVTTVPPYIDPNGVFDCARAVDFALMVVHPDRGELAALLEPVATGALVSPIDEELPLARVADIHRHQAAGALRGELILVG